MRPFGEQSGVAMTDKNDETTEEGIEYEPASMMMVKQTIRRKLRRQPHHQEQFLNIYPMMDMMVILLVFLLMQFASSTASAIQQSDDLQIPFTTSATELSEVPAIQVARDSISVGGEFVINLRNGRVDPSDKQGGANGFLITSLYRRLQDIARVQQQLEAGSGGRRVWTREIQIIADRRTPFRTLNEVTYSLGQAGFRNLRFVALSEAAQ